MTRDDDGWQTPRTRLSYALMTWHGTFLVNDPRTDWIVHRRPDETADENLLLLEADPSATGSEARLMRRRTRPRALPALAITPDQNGSHTLRCTEIGMALATPGHLLCAIPDGTIEINRTVVSDWERFLPLDEMHYDWLQRLLRRGGIAAAGDQPRPVAVGDGLSLVSEAHRIDLAANLNAAAGARPVQLTTTTGSVVSVILD